MLLLDTPDFYHRGKMLSYSYFGDGVISVHSWEIDVARDAGKSVRAKQETKRNILLETQFSS